MDSRKLVGNSSKAIPITGVKILISQKDLGSSSSRKGGSRLQIISEARPLSRNMDLRKRPASKDDHGEEHYPLKEAEDVE